MRKEIDEMYFPLSLSQLNILNLERTIAGTSVNNISTTIRITGRLDFPLLQKSISLILESDDSLRTCLTERDGQVMQYHAPYVKEDFPVYDFSNTSREGIENWESAVTRELIPLFDKPLYRFVLFRDGENSGGVLVKLHHIIADGWSQIMLCNKIGRIYLELLSGNEPDVPQAPDYRLHVQEEQEYLNSKAFAKDERYWKQMVCQSGEPSMLKSVSSAAVSHVGRRMSFDLPQILNHAIYSYCQEKRVAPFAVFYMALAIYFKRNGGAERFTIGVPIFNRTNYQFKQSTGMFVTTLPFYNEINDEWTFNQFNDSLAERWLEMLRHQRYPYSKIAELAGNEGRLFHIALSYQDSKIYESRDASVMLSGRWHYCGYQAEQLTIHLTNLKDHSQYAVDYDYLAQFFTEEDIATLHRNLCHILSEALCEPDRPIHRLNILSLEEKEQLLYTFNQTDRYLEDRSVYSALLENNVRHMNRVALIHGGERMTYGALLRYGTQFAAALTEYPTAEEKVAALLLPRKFDLPAAMIGSLQAGYAFVILSESLPTERIRTILSQSGAAVLITDEKGKDRLCDCEIPIICTEEVQYREAVLSRDIADVRDRENPGEKLAYIVYTSGSTGEPKGVEITQRNVLNLAQGMQSIYGQGAVLSVCNIGFDAFMLESLVALINGRTIVLPEDSELESPERLAALMNGYAVGFFAITPSRLSVFLQNSAFRKSMWRMESIVCGGEHFPPELLKKLKSCTHARIYNQYGPSETTVAVSMKELSNAEKITVGTPMENCKLYILDQWMNPLPVGGNGHLFVGGKSVGRGYRKNPELTEKKFRENPFVNDDKIYDTGDLAYWTPHGEVVLTGRADRQVKLRGLRIELQEVASCLEAYPGVTAAYAAVCQLNGQQVLGAYYCAHSELNETELLAHAATYLPQYMIPAFVLRVQTFPMSANGKVDESKLPAPVAAQMDDTTLSLTAETLLRIFRSVLKQDEIYGNSDYFLCGGNSLNALESIIEIEKQLGKKVRVADLYACRTAIRLAALLDGEHVSAFTAGRHTVAQASLQKAPKQAEYPLSPIQQGIYVQSVLDPNGLSYNMPGAFRLEKKPDVARLEKAFVSLIRHDPIFRTVFVQGSNGICARVLEDVDFTLEELCADNFENACAEFLRPFDLSSAPLLRAALWQSEEGEYCLFMDSHHIIGDGMTTPILLQRLDRAYAGESNAVEWNFYDHIYTAQQADAQQKKQELRYWTEHLQELPQSLMLPTDFPRQRRFDFKGAELEYSLSEADSLACREFCRENGYSEYMLFLAAYGMLLSAVSGSKDMLIGTPVAGRNHVQSADICGPFINTLPLRLKTEEGLTVRQWLDRIRDEVTGMLDHQRVDLEQIISALDLPRAEQNALYRVMLTQSPVDESKFALDGNRMCFRAIPTGTVKMDMILELAQKEKCYVLRFSYASSLFQKETIAFYGRCMGQLARELTKDISRNIGEVPLMTPMDRERLIDAPNYRVTPFVNRPIHKMLRSRGETTPDATAIIYHDRSMTYAQLERRAAAIASFLEAKGLQPGQCVGLCLKRTPDMIAAMYGVLKAGCAYMFMLNSFPAERLRYMLEISKAGIMLYDEAPAELLEGLLPCEACKLPDGEVEHYTDRPVTGEDLVNILFTSGSTGKPKGVKLRHSSVANLCAQMKSLLEPIEGRVLCSTNSVFDCFVVETVIALALGRTVVLADEEEMMLPWKLAHLIETYQTGVFEMTPSRLQMCLGNEAFCNAARHIRIVLLGGEVLTKTLLDKFYAHSDGILMNMYGPTEATVFTTMDHAKPDLHITIGAPLQNTRAYVLDEHQRPVIPTACGELYIAGECLSSGYVSRPELTESLFVEDIYFPEQKMYRSGDLVRLRLDGRFDYIGRKDAQVKLNGQRVELTEITGAMEQTGYVSQAAIVPVRNPDGSMELCAFYVPTRAAVTAEEISADISLVLPTYMIPSRMIGLETMPVTATNKIDMQKLKQLAEENSTAATVQIHTAEPVEETMPEEPVPIQVASKMIIPEKTELTSVYPDASYVLSVWNKVLSMPATDPEESFFKQGGTSMAALNVLSFYYNDGLEMTLSEFYEAPSATAQARILESRIPEGKTAQTEQKQVLVQKPEKVTALVTGVTGFMGSHLVKELLDREEYEVICLVRENSGRRLDRNLTWYFRSEEARHMKDRITFIKGDIADPTLGLSEQEYQKLVRSVDEIYHSAADVRHYASDEQAYMRTNVQGTENVLRLARSAGATFYHMSTCSVAGNSMKEGMICEAFTEDHYDAGQIWENNIYVKSKFLAEGLVFQAAREGVPVKIFRLGRLVGRADDGRFQINPDGNAFYLFMKGLLQVGAVPEQALDIKLDIMPIDLCAKEVLALKDAEGTVFHLMHPDPPSFGQVLQAIGEDYVAVSPEEFDRIFREKCWNMDLTLVPIVMETLRSMQNQKLSVCVTNKKTVTALEKKGFVFPKFSLKTALKEFGKGE